MYRVPPTSYNRIPFQYSSLTQDPTQAYQLPNGISQQFSPQFQQASQIFRKFDINRSGRLNKKEFKLAMLELGYNIDRKQLGNLFRMIDKNNSGSIDEREFCEFWAYSQHYHQPGFGHQYFFGQGSQGTQGVNNLEAVAVHPVAGITTQQIASHQPAPEGVMVQPTAGLVTQSVPSTQQSEGVAVHPVGALNTQTVQSVQQTEGVMVQPISRLVQESVQTTQQTEGVAVRPVAGIQTQEIPNLRPAAEGVMVQPVAALVTQSVESNIAPSEGVAVHPIAGLVTQTVESQQSSEGIYVQPVARLVAQPITIQPAPTQGYVVYPETNLFAQPLSQFQQQGQFQIPGLGQVHLIPPTNYNRLPFQYSSQMQDPLQPYMLPNGISQQFSPLFQQASAVFRQFDTNRTGRLNKREFKNALIQLGYNVDRKQLGNLFRMIDRNNSGSIDEREFCEFWAYSQHYHQPGFGPQYFMGQGLGMGQQGYGLGQQGYGLGQQGYGLGQQGYGLGQQGYGLGQQGLGMGQQGLGMGQQGLGLGQQGLGLGHGLGSHHWSQHLPTSYNRIPFQYASQIQDPRQQYMLPTGISPQFAPQFQQASAVFRQFDTNHTGRLNKREFKNAWFQLGYTGDRKQLGNLFRMIDRNNSGSIDEREFCEFWAYSQHHNQPGFGPQYFGLGQGLGMGQQGLGMGQQGLGMGQQGLGMGQQGLGIGQQGLGIGQQGLGGIGHQGLGHQGLGHQGLGHQGLGSSLLHLIPPTSYNRIPFQYSSLTQDPRQSYMLPNGISSQFSPQFQQASAAFRQFDIDHTGRIGEKEFKLAMAHLGYNVDSTQLSNLFRMIDKNGSGKIDEREFVEFWVYSQNYHNPGFGNQYFFGQQGSAPIRSRSGETLHSHSDTTRSGGSGGIMESVREKVLDAKDALVDKANELKQRRSDKHGYIFIFSRTYAALSNYNCLHVVPNLVSVSSYYKI